MDIKVVSPIAVHDKYWDADTLCYRRTTAVTSIEQKRVPEQIATIIERAEKTFSEKADGKWMKQVIEYVLYPARAFERDHPNLLHRIHEYLEKYDGAERTKEHIVRFERTITRYHEYRRELLGDTDFTLFVETVNLGQMNDFGSTSPTSTCSARSILTFIFPVCSSTTSLSLSPTRPSSIP